ncbi:hypothetical protein C2857_000372 [Epichloe festucae Fl1]|uniref:Major facilitator superfamily (MFS) profile domain-containing protein n=1 Tax=Epichloe festucae (strain Fl1) TaxID=877507 RepID=A0A7S9PX60_EPIFF|nr:hypothetical protein C2857_000372 [Epichloe festucae Fl1]
MASSPAAGVTANQNVDTAMQVVTEAPRPASWASMPQKRQLALIVVARFCETVASGSLQSYIIFQLQSFTLSDGSAPSTATVALQLSVLRACVATPELVTSTLWGVLADHPRVGRKLVIVASLVMQGIGSLALGFTRGFAGAVLCRLLVGLASSNKAATRSMIREISGDRFESRAVLLLPAAFNVGSVVGPVLGGFLAEGAVSGTGGMQTWFPAWPFALPNMVNGIMLVGCAALMAFHLRETLPDEAGARSGRRVHVSMVPGWARRLHRRYFRQQPARYELLTDQEEHELNELDNRDDRGERQTDDDNDDKQRHVGLWTRRLGLTLAARALLVMHVFTYPSLLLVFVSTPRYQPVDGEDGTGVVQRATAPATVTNGSAPFVHVPPGYHPRAPFTFTGGLAFRPHDVAMVLAIRGVVGLLLQLLFFPYLRDVVGTLRLYRYALVVFPLTYLATPYLATVPSSTPPPLPAAGASLWAIMSAILMLQSTARSLALPAGAMLLNAACPDRSVLSTVNGIGGSVSAAARAIGQLLMTGWLYGKGLEAGIVGAAWWAMAGVAVAAAVAAACVPAGSGGSLA